ncbi:hypothetical protein EYF80_065356 [Liparis tanakae]|uniref:Uncharacterized protein n=1 Tax=Liparis tanakae TaxID=230148 RepID=A0A4Z2E6U2_9TELE|nr:hypothetical protein EYF80_065356 [Liparis tanakae]
MFSRHLFSALHWDPGEKASACLSGPQPALPFPAPAQALEAVWAVKFKMHIEDAGVLPTGDHIEVLSDTQLQLVARLPHI